jgi:hypothetical protein
MIIKRTVPVHASSLIEVVRSHLGAPGAPARAGVPPPVPPSAVLAARLTDPRKPRGIRHSLGSLVSVLVAGVACGYSSPLAIAGAAAGWDQEVLAAHGTRRNPVTRLHEPPAGEALREVRADGWFRAAPGHPWLDRAVTGDPAHRPAVAAVAVDGKERKLAKAAGRTRKCTCWAPSLTAPGW